MRDWSATLLPASLGGVPFHVRRDEIEAGRRQVVHTIPNGGHVIEEFGPSPRRYALDARLLGDAADLLAAALLAVAERKGPHLLVLPTGAALVSLEPNGLRRSFDKDRLGEIVVEIQAVAAGPAAAPGFGLPLGAAASAAVLVAAVFAAGDRLFAGLGGFAIGLVAGVAMTGARAGGLGVAVPALVSGAVTALALVEVARLAAAPSIRVSAVVLATAETKTVTTEAEARAAAEAEADVALADIADRIAERVETVGDVVADPARFAIAFGETVRALADLTAPADWERCAADLLALTATPSPAAATVATRAADAGAEVGPALARVAALASVMEAAARRDWPDRVTARAARARITSLVAAETARLARSTPVPAATIDDLVALRDATVTLLGATITRLSPVMTIDAPSSRPALAWSWDLWQDPSRALDLARTNGVVHPGRMPRRFDAEVA